MSQTRISKQKYELLRKIALSFVALTVAIYLVNGEPIFDAVVGGMAMGGLSFIASATLLFAYLGAKSTVTG